LSALVVHVPELPLQSVDASLELIDYLERQIAEINRDLKASGAEHPYVPLLLTVPGIEKQKRLRAARLAWPPLTGADFGPMHLVGQHSNPSEFLEVVLGWVPDAPGRSRREPVAALSRAKRLGNGVVQRGLIKALTVSDRSMGVSEAQAAVEALLGHCVSRDSVNSCLSTGARGARPRFERVTPGRYRLARDP